MIRNVLRSYRSTIIMAALILSLITGAAYSGMTICEAIQNGFIEARHGEIIFKMESPELFYYNIAKNFFGLICCGFGAFGLTLQAHKMHKKGLLFVKERLPKMPRHFSAPLIDPTKRSNK